MKDYFSTTHFPQIQVHVTSILDLVDALDSSSYVTVERSTVQERFAPSLINPHGSQP